MTALTTRQGDTGWTRDASGRRVGKDDPLIEAYGALDELVCVMGWLHSACPDVHRSTVARWRAYGMSVLAGMCGGAGPDTDAVLDLETDIARLLPEPRTGFVIPGGCEASSRAHIVRAVCRRAERRVIAAMGHESEATPVLNRLSDALFALAVALEELHLDG
ncbi:MAG: ATP:cob(I)alamin adenosyltransferase [Candidatus Eisenbacteria bacterium]|nr:ATP:cob(I)alamin adenosyltransferase [Candidatus Eisenbacteria bacterium]